VFAEPEHERRLRCQSSGDYTFEAIQLTNQTSHDASDSRCNLKEMRNSLWVQKLVLLSSVMVPPGGRERHTGTLRWVMTTAVSLPRTATAVTPAPVMALKAYSGD
jgi:hypothetical protein